MIPLDVDHGAEERTRRHRRLNRLLLAVLTVEATATVGAHVAHSPLPHLYDED